MRARSLILLTLIAGCTGEPVAPATSSANQPLIGGTPITTDPAVVSMHRSDLSLICSGTLISPSVVLTAAHCVDLAGADLALSVFFGSDFNGEGMRVDTRRKFQHPMWSGDVGMWDVGLLLLSFSQDPELPVPINREPLDLHLGEPYRHVGFGRKNPDNGEIDGLKREGWTTIFRTVTDVVETNDPTVHVCNGDSGGPGFFTFEGVEYVAGIHSYTHGSTCQPTHGDTRVDLYADLLEEWIQANDPVCGADGVCAHKGCTNDPDCEPCGPDGTCTSDCPLPDPDCPTSGVGEICQAASQCVDGGPCLFWQGDPSSRFCTRACDPANDDCPAAMSCQNIAGAGNVCYYDDDPPFVLGSTCEVATDCGSYVCDDNECSKRCDLSLGLTCPLEFECRASNGDYYCHSIAKPDSGGCSSGGGSGLALALALLAAALVRVRGRCWRRGWFRGTL